MASHHEHGKEKEEEEPTNLTGGDEKSEDVQQSEAAPLDENPQESNEEEPSAKEENDTEEKERSEYDGSPEPETAQFPGLEEAGEHEQTGDNDDAGEEQPKSRLSMVSQVESQDPQDFESKSFLGSVSELSEQLEDDSFRNLNEDYPAEQLKSMLSAISVNMENFKNYSQYSQQQMEHLRHQMKDIRDKIHKKIHLNTRDHEENRRQSAEEMELEAKLAELNSELAKVGEELTRASKVSAETEAAAVEAGIAASKASEEAQQIQEDYEARRKTEMEEKRKEEEKRQEEERKKAEEERHLEEQRQAEEARKNKLKKPNAENKAPEWEEYPTFTYNIDEGEFDQGIGCLIRANPNTFREDQVSCKRINQLESDFTYQENEELVSNVISLEGDLAEEKVYVSIPHCTTRASAIAREPVIKARVDGTWTELQSQEVTFDQFKDLKFVQAEVTQATDLAVVTRFKRDFLQIQKRGGKVISSVDQRLTFFTERNTFKKPENFIVQLQPIDSGMMNDMRLRPEGKGLLTASALVNMEWSSKTFDHPVTVTLPCPPNPVKAKKAAAIRAAKEEKMNNPQRGDGESRQRDDSRHNKDKQTNKWYMGQYAINDDDESEVLYMVIKKPNGKWVTQEDMVIDPTRLDLVQFSLYQPLTRFMVLRAKPSVDPKDAQHIVSLFEKQFTQRQVTAILKQRNDDPCDILLHLTSPQRSDKTLKQVEEDGYEEGPQPNTGLMLQEGDLLEVAFRGNIKGEEETPPLLMIYNSQLTNSLKFYVLEVDKFLQKSYSVYRGFVQVNKKTKMEPPPPKEEDKKKEEKKEDGEETEEEQKEPEIIYKSDLLCEHLISIPKEPPSGPQPITRAPIVIKNWQDPINEDFLREIAGDMGEEWQQIAHLLNVKRMRIQAILRNNSSHRAESDEEARYQMLMTWAKKVPRGVNKAIILRKALSQTGREDLVERLDEQNDAFVHKKGVTA